MLKLSLKQFFLILIFQFFFLLIDLLINSFSYLARGDKLTIIFLFLIQDVSIIFSFTLLMFSLYSTHIYQFGLIELLFNKFRGVLIVLLFYFVLCISHHIWIVVDHEKTLYSFQWPTSLFILFIVQRLLSPIYYYLYKRAALRMCDPRFYDNMEWINEQLSIK